MIVFVYYKKYSLGSLVPDDEVIKAAIDKASSMFNSRLSDYKRLWKTLIRLVRETYTDEVSDEFAMYYVFSGLMNFAKHYSNDHGDCSRYIWFCRCSHDAKLVSYYPSQPYVNESPSNFGNVCDVLSVAVFKFMVVSWTMSAWNESNVYKNIRAVITTSCESFNHAMCLYNPKSLNIKEREYLDNCYACFIAYVTKQQGGRNHRKVLKHNKNSDTFIATNSYKRGNDSLHVIDALKNILPGDEETLRGVIVAEKRMKKLAENRSSRKNLYEIDVQGGNLSGVELGHQADKLRPCAPFPFKNDDMLENDPIKKEAFLKMLMNTVLVKELESQRMERITKKQREEVDLYDPQRNIEDAEVEVVEQS